MQFKYTVLTKAGQTVTGVTEAPSEHVAEEALWRAGYTIARLEAIRPAPSVRELLPSLFAVQRQDIIIFSRQLATLLTAGVAILPALQLLADQVSNSTLRLALLEVTEDIQSGTSFSEALSKHPDVFPVIYYRMIQVGERTGQLEILLRQLATYMGKEEAIGKKIQGAMVYPAIVLTLAVGVILLLLTVALPAMMGLYAELKVELPLPTRILLGLTNFTRDYGVIVFIGLIVLGAATVMYTRTTTGRWQFHYFLLRMPALGAVNLKGSISRFARTMSILLRAGLPLTEVMDLLLQTTQNDVIRNALIEVRAQLMTGLGLSVPMGGQRIFPKLLVQMVRVGEETGTLDSTLDTLADFYEEEADRAISTLTALIEPVMMMFVGAVVGFIAISVITPMYSIMGSIK